MAGSLNRVTLIGNVGKDPEIRDLQNGGKVASFSVATSESWKDKASGERKEKTEWHNVVIWNEGIIGVVEKYVSKGSKLMVEGQMQTSKWQDQQGNDRYTTEVVLSGFNGSLLLLGDAGGGGRPPPADTPPENRSADYGAAKSGDKPPAAGKRLDGDIPF